MLEREKPDSKEVSEEELQAFLRKEFSNLSDVLLSDAARSKLELQQRIESLILSPIVFDGEAAYEIIGDPRLFSARK